MAISVDSREDSVRLSERLGLNFPLLSDPDMRVIKAYGVAMQGQDIAVPATFVVRSDSTIAWKKIGESMADRPRLDALVHEVGKAR